MWVLWFLFTAGILYLLNRFANDRAPSHRPWRGEEREPFITRHPLVVIFSVCGSLVLMAWLLGSHSPFTG